MKKITILGIGGAGTSMGIHMHTPLNAELILLNTDKVAMEQCWGYRCLIIGPKISMGRRASSTRIGRQAAEESLGEVENAIGKPDLLVIAVGLGGATGTGASAVIARRAKELGIAVIVAATLPLNIEHDRRQLALQALKELDDIKILTLTHDLADAENRLADRPLLDLFDDEEKSLTGLLRNYVTDETLLS